MKIYFQIIILFLFIILKPMYSFGNQLPEDSIAINTENSFHYIDSVYSLLFTDISSENTNFHEYNFHPETVPVYSDSVYAERIHNLNVGSTFDFRYNEEVREYIYYFGKKRAGFIAQAIAVKDMYFPLFEQVLDKYNLPLELKYLAIVESALNPNAKSRAGAVGLWQFMPATGRYYGLNQSSYIDDRRDPYEATEAACRYFIDLYNIYHDWNLVLASYNAGPGNVNKAIARSGGKKDYWSIRPFLPRETGGYVPAFIAVNYLINYAEAHNILISNKEDFNFYLFDTILVDQKITLSNVSDWLNISVDEIKRLNPQYIKGIIPASQNSKMKLVLPVGMIREFILYKEYIIAGISRQEAEQRAELNFRTTRIN